MAMQFSQGDKTNNIFMFVTFLILMIMLSMFASPGDIYALKPGESAHDFHLKDLQGKAFALSDVEGTPLTVLYFFSPTSEASRHGMDLLTDLYQTHGVQNVAIVVISVGPFSETKRWAKDLSKAKVTVLIDDGSVSRLYDAVQILPIAYLLGPDFQILDRVTGGGPGGHKLLVRLAEKEMSRKDINVAKALAKEAVKQNPSNPEAKAVLGYASLKQGKIDEAEKIFTEMATVSGPQKTLGQEGLAYVRLHQGATNEALALAKQTKGRAGADTLQGDILYAKGDKAGARAAYRRALEDPAFSFQQAVPYNRLGKMAVTEKRFSEARDLYDKALRIDPYAVEVLSNKGVSYAKQGNWDQAVATYRRVLDMDPRDQIALGLMRQAQNMLALAKDAQKAERIDRLIKELSQRYREGGDRHRRNEDQWTSRPLVLAFLPAEETGFPGDRDGLYMAFVLETGRLLEANGRIRIVERVVLDRLLEELNLGSSELADPDTELRLGHVLAARLLATGMLGYSPDGAYLNLRLIDSETTAIPAVLSTRLNPDTLDQFSGKIASGIIERLQTRYPLQGYIVQVHGQEVILNLGSDHGMHPGLHFQVLEEGESIKYKGKTLKRSLQPVGNLEVSDVEPGLSRAKVIKASKEIKKDMKVREVQPTETL
jgi:tetratricopeptide (TPR) repeat protein